VEAEQGGRRGDGLGPFQDCGQSCRIHGVSLEVRQADRADLGSADPIMLQRPSRPAVSHGRQSNPRSFLVCRLHPLDPPMVIALPPSNDKLTRPSSAPPIRLRERQPVGAQRPIIPFNPRAIGSRRRQSGPHPAVTRCGGSGPTAAKRRNRMVSRCFSPATKPASSTALSKPAPGHPDGDRGLRRGHQGPAETTFPIAVHPLAQRGLRPDLRLYCCVRLPFTTPETPRPAQTARGLK